MPLHLLRATLLVTAIAFSSPGLSADQPASQKALVAALQAGELDTAIGLLRSGPPVNQPVDRNNTTLLHLASRSGLAPVVARILELGASPHARDTGGRSALHYLAEANPASSGALQCLLATGSLLVDDLDSTGRTPLSLAAATGNIPTATILFRAGADPLANSLDATSPLKTATQKRNTALLNLFHGTPPPTDPNPLRKASQGGYPSPGLSTPLFAASGLTLPQQTRDLLQKNLATLGRNFPGSPIVDDRLRARALAVALSLDRRYRPAVVADAQLRRGLKPATLPSSSSPLHVATGFRNFAQRLSPDTSSSDDRRLASLLVDIASKIDPSISVEHLPAPDWTPAFAVSGTSPPPTSLYASAPPPSLPDASIRTIALTGKPGTFSPVDLSSTARPRPPHAPQSAARFTTPGTGGLAAAITASKTIHPWPEGYQIVLSIPPTIVAADTRVTGLATALLVSSHCSARPLDPDIAAFAEITPDGQLSGVSDVSARLRSAIDSGCKTVILPTSATAEITDAVTLGATDIVRDIQIYIAPDLASAFAIATASPPYAAASTEFLLVQALTKSGRISSSEAISRLRVVASSAPGNLSAQLLVAAASGTLPKQLSPRTSAAKIRILANRLMAPIDPGRGYPHPMQYQATTLEAIRSALTRHRPMLAPETRRAADATTDLATLLGRYLHTLPRSRDGKQKMAIALKAATGDLVAKLAQLDKLSAPQTAP